MDRVAARRAIGEAGHRPAAGGAEKVQVGVEEAVGANHPRLDLTGGQRIDKLLVRGDVGELAQPSAAERGNVADRGTPLRKRASSRWPLMTASTRRNDMRSPLASSVQGCPAADSTASTPSKAASRRPGSGSSRSIATTSPSAATRLALRGVANQRRHPAAVGKRLGDEVAAEVPTGAGHQDVLHLSPRASAHVACAHGSSRYPSGGPFPSTSEAFLFIDQIDGFPAQTRT